MLSKCKLSVAASLALAASVAQAQISDGVVKIGVLSDMSSLYSDIGGAGSVVAARMAVDDYGAARKGMKVELLSADHLNKPDVGSSIARQWYDVDKVDVIVDVPTSSIALAVSQITREKGKAFLVSGAATSDLTGKACSPNTIHWTYDTWMLANGTGNASGSPTPAATPPTRSSRPPSSASSGAGRTSPACWCSSPTCTASAWTRLRG